MNMKVAIEQASKTSNAVTTSAGRVPTGIRFSLEAVIDRRTRLAFAAAAATLMSTSPLRAATIEELARLSLEELSNVEVTSVSKSAKALRDAPASIYVITRDEILRSGARSVPEALRLAPNLEIRQQNASSHVGAARGFAGNPVAQNFSNKLLILIDGRSVYSPLFSGVYYDAQDVLLEDIDRIEVISGPGATLWGANAMNGVINIITRTADATAGGFVSVGGGNLEREANARYGGRIDELDYRVYSKAFKRDAMQLANGAGAEDDWQKVQAGFRLDWNEGDTTLTAQGDGYRAAENQLGALDLTAKGANLLGRWQHRGERSDLQLQAYFDHTQRSQPPGGAAFVVRTYDFEVQDRLTLGSRHTLVVGGGKRLNRYDITNSTSLLFVPSDRTLGIGNVFAQDTIKLSDRFQLSVGIKLEEDPYSGWSVLPDARFSWQLGETAMMWASGARAIRSPTPFDHDVVERVGAVDFLTGNSAFRAERVDAFDLGLRALPAAQLSLTIVGFYNRYDDLRTIEPASATVFLPIRWDNMMRGTTYGLEAWAKWQVLDWWRLSPGFRTVRKSLEFKSGASRLLGFAQAANDPRSQASLVSSMDLNHALTFDVFFRYVGALPDPALESYYELNARLGWEVTPAVELSVTGSNLLHRRHRESPMPEDAEIDRGLFAEARWRF